MTVHGLNAYNTQGCRCETCRTAKSDYKAAQHLGVHQVDREALTAFLRDLLPQGLTEDCPARKTAEAHA